MALKADDASYPAESVATSASLSQTTVTRARPGAGGWEQEMFDEDTARQVQANAVASHLLEAKVRRAILEQLFAQAEQVVGAREILDLAEGFAWITNPSQAHGGGR